jgi:hypothetical protein
MNISNFDDVIDSRDVIERIEELESERQSLVDAVDGAQETITDATDDTSVLANDAEELEALGATLTEAEGELKDFDESEDGEELKTLKELAEECEGYSDWADGETLIRDGYFEEYAQDLAEDLGINQSWPYSCIDWERAARELQYDYSSVWWGDICYWIRS